MKTVIIIIVIFLFPGVVSSQEKFANTRFYNDTVESPQATLENIQWLAGHWLGDGLGGTTEEVWTAPLGNSMMCAFKFLQNDEVKFYELVTITEENGTLIMRLKHFHADLKGWEEKDETVDFKLVKVNGNKFYFDGLTIEKVNDERMNIYVVIEDGDGKKEVKFEYHRSKSFANNSIRDAYLNFKEQVDSLFRNELPDFSGRILIATNKMDSIIYDQSFGYADFDLKIPYSPTIANGIASLSKQFTAAGILKLKENSVLKLDDSLAMYFDNLPENKRVITIHQLLTHTSGLPLYSGKDAAVCSKDDFFNWFVDVELISKPGERYSYSNPGYTMLALLIEELSDKSHIIYLRETFFDQLKLNSTGYRYPRNPLAVSYDNGKRIGTSTETPWAPDGPYWNLRGAGGIISTLDDLLTWFRALYGGSILNKENTTSMFEKHISESENSWYGYGWHIIEDEKGKWIDHSGSDGYKFTDIRYFESYDLLLIFTTNNFKINEVKTIVNKIPSIYGIE